MSSVCVKKLVTLGIFFGLTILKDSFTLKKQIHLNP